MPFGLWVYKIKLENDKIITQHFKQSTFDKEDSRASIPTALEEHHIHVKIPYNEIKFGTLVYPNMGT